MGFVDKDKFVVLGKTFYNDEDIIIVDIVDKILRFKQFDDEVYSDQSLSLFKYW